MPETTYVLAIDQGTTSSRAIVFDHSGHIVSVKSSSAYVRTHLKRTFRTV